MKFDDLDKEMRLYETINDFSILPNMYIVARIDGRGFTKLTKEKHSFEAPFDIQFHNYMVETTIHLMNCGLKVIYAYTQSDEISLLFDLKENSFSRKTRKWNSILAGEASAKFSLLLNDIGTFDCRLSQFPNEELVFDYFRWRNEDAHRNSLNAYCYWTLRQNGLNKVDATKRIESKSIAFKNELLFSYGINYNDLPSWQKRGVGLYWEKEQKKGFNPIKNETTIVERNSLIINKELPLKDEYIDIIRNTLQQ